MFSRIITLTAAVCLLSAAGTVSAHSGKARFHVIVDTDGAADDLRSLCMLLGCHDTEVLCIVSSPGAQTTLRTAQCARELLAALYHDGIPVGCGREACAAAPAWRKHCEQVAWGDEHSQPKEFPAAVQLIESTIDGEEEPVTIVALGALTNVADLLHRCPDKARHIERIVWYDDLPCGTGANYKADADAARHVLWCGLPVEIVSDNGARHIAVTESLIDAIAEIPTPYARRIADTHRRPPLDSLAECRHLTAWDDLTVLYMLYPEIFVRHPLGDNTTYCTLTEEITPECARRMLLSVLWGRPDAENRVFYDFPSNGEAYAADVREIMDEAIRQHGASEWRAAVLTNEMHGHLGIYATIGVKMGMRAREWFGVGVDDMEVVSSAGLTPPVSCMNDGLQVATGGSLGHGLIRAEATDVPRPEATFTFKGRTLRLRLKEEYAQRIAEDCRRGAEQCGGLGEEYWRYVRALALGYWRDLDRHAIFSIEELSVSPERQ